MSERDPEPDPAASGHPGVRLLPYGRNALLAEVSSTELATRLYTAVRAALQGHGVQGDRLAVLEVVPGARTVLFDGVGDPGALRDWLGDWLPAWRPDDEPVEAGGGEVVEVPTIYDGTDLADVARRWGMTRDEAVTTHAGLDFTVAFCGFAPGFAYCTGLPSELAVPRLAEPRPRVPAGSVALADVFTGVYPGPSPGGWRLLGRTPMTLWDPASTRPAALVPGTAVRFVPVGSGEPDPGRTAP